MSSSAIAFEALTEALLPMALAIERAAQPTPWTEGNFRDALRAGYWCVLAHHAEHGYAGIAVVMRGVDEAEVLTISVLLNARRLGIGRALLRHALAALPHATRLHLEVRASNASALAFYHRLGFEAVGRRRGYYPATAESALREDAVLMSLNNFSQL